MLKRGIKAESKFEMFCVWTEIFPFCGEILTKNCLLLVNVWHFSGQIRFLLTFLENLILWSTGCPVKLSTLWFCYFLGFQITYRRTSDHFSIAQEMSISKLTLHYFISEKFIKLQHKTWDKLDFESIILMADFASS